MVHQHGLGDQVNEWQSSSATSTSPEQFNQQAVAPPNPSHTSSAVVKQSRDVSDGGNEPSHFGSNNESRALSTTPVQQSSDTTALGADWPLTPILGEDRGTLPDSILNSYRYVPRVTVLLINSLSLVIIMELQIKPSSRCHINETQPTITKL